MAERYRVTERTLRRWIDVGRKAGIRPPLHDPEMMPRWWEQMRGKGLLKQRVPEPIEEAAQAVKAYRIVPEGYVTMVELHKEITGDGAWPSLTTINRWAVKNWIPHVKTGNRYYFKVEDVREQMRKAGFAGSLANSPRGPKRTPLRDVFAGQALAGEMAAQGRFNATIGNGVEDQYLLGRAKLFYRFADAMLAARAMPNEQPKKKETEQ